MVKHRKKEYKYGRTRTGIDPQFPKTPIERDTMRFSFKYLELTHQIFNLSSVNYKKYLTKLLQRLKGVSSWSSNNFSCTASKALRAHKVVWSRPTVQVNGFGIIGRKDLNEKAFQFSISANEYGRVLGFMIGNTFFIRWLDPQHQCDIGKQNQ